MSAISIYWFRDDLRLSDLPGLKAAAEAGRSFRFISWITRSARNGAWVAQADGGYTAAAAVRSTGGTGW